jgi:hypothetical protein
MINMLFKPNIMTILNTFFKNNYRCSRILLSKKYGVDLVRFTHDKDSILKASKNDFDCE